MLVDRKEKIAIKACELFAQNGYDNTSVSELQFALDMGRGTLYYYYKDKDDLFTDVMNRFFLVPKQQVFSQLADQVTIPQMIDALCTYLHSLEELLNQFDNRKMNTSNAVTLMYTAYNRFPELYKKAHEVYERELKLWKQALCNEMNAGIVRSDIPLDTVSMMFTHIKDGFDTGRTGVTMDFSLFRTQYNYLYDLLKTKLVD